jgi:iron(III) transport system ATP-binding protein
MTRVRIEEIRKRFGDTPAIDGITLDVPPGELFTLVGPSGCGKTTLLRIIAGLLEQDAGTVHFDGDRMDGVPPYLRNIGVVFQNYAIFPHLTVEKNIAYGLKARGFPSERILAKVAEAARLVHLEELLGRMPAQLSGGQQQRVVLARALVIQPRLLLMDEPLSNLDAKLRVQIRSLIRRLQRELGITTIYVTHDQEEALAISDTIAVMDRGRLLQVGRPWELYLRPRSRFVADFIGMMNIVDARVQGPGHRGRGVTVRTSFGEEWQIAVGAACGSALAIGIRPEALRDGAGSEPDTVWNQVKGSVRDVAYLGSVVRYVVTVAEGVELLAEIHNPDFTSIKQAGDQITLWFPGDRVIALPDAGAGSD